MFWFPFVSSQTYCCVYLKKNVFIAHFNSSQVRIRRPVHSHVSKAYYTYSVGTYFLFFHCHLSLNIALLSPWPADCKGSALPPALSVTQRCLISCFLLVSRLFFVLFLKIPNNPKPNKRQKRGGMKIKLSKLCFGSEASAGWVQRKCPSILFNN